MNLTKKRIELLQAVADGEVSGRYDAGAGWRTVWDHDPGGLRRRFSSPAVAILFLHDNGLIVPVPLGADRHADRAWKLTDEGRAALQAHGGRP